MAREGLPAVASPCSVDVRTGAHALVPPAPRALREVFTRLGSRPPANGDEDDSTGPRTPGRWRVLECFDLDGHRYAVVRLVDPRARPLSPREAEVLARSSAGESNKEISYELGLAWSTVRVLLHRARRKLALRALQEARQEEARTGDRGDVRTTGSAPEP